MRISERNPDHRTRSWWRGASGIQQKASFLVGEEMLGLRWLKQVKNDLKVRIHYADSGTGIQKAPSQVL